MAHRSPNYPVINLETSLSYLEKLWAHAKGRHAVPVAAAVKDAWEMKPDSAYGLQVAAALKAFGLTEDTGKASARHIRVSEVGAKIRGQHSERENLLREAALLPPIHQELWERFGTPEGLPPASTLRQYLVFDRDGHRFNEATVLKFIAEFTETVSFAKLSEATKIDQDGERDDDVDDGDSGADQEKGEKKSTPSKGKRHMEPGLKEDKFTLNGDEGDVILYWPESISSSNVQDVEDWMEIILRKVKRQAKSNDGGHDGDALQATAPAP